MAAAWCRWVICREVDLPALLPHRPEPCGAGNGRCWGSCCWSAAAGQRGRETERFPLGLAQDRPAPAPASAIPHPGWGAGPSAGLENVSGGAGQLAMGCCVLAGLAGGCFKAGTQRDRRGAKLDAGGSWRGLRSRPGFLKEHTRPVEWDQKKERAPCLAPAGCGGRFGTIWGLSHSLAAAGPVGEAAALVLLALLWLLSEQPWRKKKGRSAAAEPGVTIQGSSLERYQEALEDFCRAMKIPALLVTETQEGTVNASARLSPGQVPELRVTGGLLKQAELLFQRTGNLEQMDRTVLSILGHELSHIAHRDALQLERRAREGGTGQRRHLPAAGGIGPAPAGGCPTARSPAGPLSGGRPALWEDPDGPPVLGTDV